MITHAGGFIESLERDGSGFFITDLSMTLAQRRSACSFPGTLVWWRLIIFRYIAIHRFKNKFWYAHDGCRIVCVRIDYSAHSTVWFYVASECRHISRRCTEMLGVFCREGSKSKVWSLDLNRARQSTARIACGGLWDQQSRMSELCTFQIMQVTFCKR